jgi:hypothetical protein
LPGRAEEEPEVSEQVEVGEGGVAYKVITGQIIPGDYRLSVLAYETLTDKRQELVGVANEMMRETVATSRAGQ